MINPNDQAMVITSNGHGETKVYLDGQEVRGVKAVNFSQDIKTEYPVLSIELFAIHKGEEK